jgi:hypothetical protein
VTIDYDAFTEFHWQITTDFARPKGILVSFAVEPRLPSRKVFQWTIVTPLAKYADYYALGAREGFGTLETVQRLFDVPQSIVKEITDLLSQKNS